MAETTQSLLDKIPDEQEVRRRIAENQREAALLRKLLRVSREKTNTLIPAAGQQPGDHGEARQRPRAQYPGLGHDAAHGRGGGRVGGELVLVTSLNPRA